MKKIVIIGAGGFAKEVAFLIEEINRFKPEWEILGYIVNTKDIETGKYPVFNDDNWLINTNTNLNVVFGIGEPNLIYKLYNLFKQNKNLSFPNLIHPSVIGNWERIKIGVGNVFTAGVNMTTDIEIGSFNIFNLNCTVGHNCKIGNFNIFNPTTNLSGGLVIEDRVLIGTGTQILQYKKIVSNAIVGAGAVVTKDILESGIYVGAPAKKLER